MGILFTTFLTLAVLSFSLAEITEYSSLKSGVVDLLASQGQIGQAYPFVLEYCKNPSQSIYTMDVDCEKVKAQTEEEFVQSYASQAFDSMYYAKYDCEVLDCIKQQPQMIISARGNELFRNGFYICTLLSAASAAMLFVSTRSWGRAKAFGTALIFVGATYFVLLFAKAAIPKITQIPQASSLINSIFGVFEFNFLVILVAGIVLLAAGFIGSRKKKKKRKHT